MLLRLDARVAHRHDDRVTPAAVLPLHARRQQQRRHPPIPREQQLRPLPAKQAHLPTILVPHRRVERERAHPQHPRARVVPRVRVPPDQRPVAEPAARLQRVRQHVPVAARVAKHKRVLGGLREHRAGLDFGVRAKVAARGNGDVDHLGAEAVLRTPAVRQQHRGGRVAIRAQRERRGIRHVRVPVRAAVLAPEYLPGIRPRPQIPAYLYRYAALAVVRVPRAAREPLRCALTRHVRRAADVVHQIRLVRRAVHHRRVVRKCARHLLREDVRPGGARARLGAHDARVRRPVVQPAAVRELGDEEVVQPGVYGVRHDAGAPRGDARAVVAGAPRADRAQVEHAAVGAGPAGVARARAGAAEAVEAAVLVGGAAVGQLASRRRDGEEMWECPAGRLEQALHRVRLVCRFVVLYELGDGVGDAGEHGGRVRPFR
ncbi:hypothetical protein ISF_08856 [Cordyceps fumosorosea ARSEF 2679]|uniref:Uncharacterized protein n=1 Tax=Cordyceps fumosorosea (strain ARSEF 2679) TaxID=1081104 RepID=A0A162I7I2_CORFA|nr:hypothetical protein ISF_08856 [Cordyceps fumosorosea ARSEF 2679]OAA53375.1 hypothetical protein ISF_08856 [Cordyceps fumosorosea ARSEF 2679]